MKTQMEKFPFKANGLVFSIHLMKHLLWEKFH